jgi:hypothetical protein
MSIKPYLKKDTYVFIQSCVISSVKGPDNLTGHRSSGKLDSNQTINYRREKR